MKKIFALFVACVALSLPLSAALTPKESAETSPTVWVKKAKKYHKAELSTYVAEIGDSGYATSDAPFVVIPIKTASEKNQENGKIFVLIPFGSYENFGKAYEPEIAKGGSAFGSKKILKKITGTFLMYKKEPVLVVGVKLDQLKNAPVPSEQLEKQLADADKESGADQASRPGYTKKIFRVSAIGKDAKLKSEFNKLVSLYNKGKKSLERMKPAEMLGTLEDGSDPFTVFDEAKKIEWEIRL